MIERTKTLFPVNPFPQVENSMSDLRHDEIMGRQNISMDRQLLKVKSSPH